MTEVETSEGNRMADQNKTYNCAENVSTKSAKKERSGFEFKFHERWVGGTIYSFTGGGGPRRQKKARNPGPAYKSVFHQIWIGNGLIMDRPK